MRWRIYGQYSHFLECLYCEKRTLLSIHQQKENPSHVRTRQNMQLNWYTCTGAEKNPSFGGTKFHCSFSSPEGKQMQWCQGWSGGLATKSAGTRLEKCLWSALLVTVAMYQSASGATAHWGEIGLCLNWNILSCAWLNVDLWTHFQLIERFLIGPYSHISHSRPSSLVFPVSQSSEWKEANMFSKAALRL